jgi:drug/metabolite transporter (DMT)-like permease
MALCFVLYLQMSRAMSSEDILASLFYTAFSVWVVLSFLMPFYWVTPNWQDMLVFIAIGLVGFVGIYGFDKAVEAAPTWVSAPFALVQPIVFTGLNFILRGINPGRLSLAASGLILACFGILLWRASPLRLKSGIKNV